MNKKILIICFTVLLLASVSIGFQTSARAESDLKIASLSLYSTTINQELYIVSEATVSNGSEPYRYTYELYCDRDRMYVVENMAISYWRFHCHTYFSKIGTYYVVVTVTDADGNTATTKTSNHVDWLSGAYAILDSCPNCKSPYRIEDQAKEPNCTEQGFTEGAHCAECGAVIIAQNSIPALGHVVEIDAGVAPTCTKSGLSEGTHCRFCHEILVEQTLIPATGHSLTKHKKVEATCTEEGYLAYWSCNTCGKLFGDKSALAEIQAPIVIEAKGHRWNKPSYVWSKDYSHVTASRTCANDSTHVTIEIVPTTSKITTEPTCTTKGQTTYTSYAFYSNFFKKQKKTITNLPATGHDWDKAIYIWSEDYSTVTAERICKNDSTHDQREIVETTYQVTKAPTYTAKGTGLYTSAAFENTAFKVQKKKITLATLPRTDIGNATVSKIKDQVYSGKAIKPDVTVKYNNKKLTKGTDYTVTYSNNKKIGTATVTIKGKNAFKGTIKQTFKINPKSVNLTSLTPGDKQLTVKWQKGSNITGYEIEYGLKKSFKGAAKITISKAYTTKKAITELQNKKVYYVRIRTYKVVGSATYYSDWSDAMNAKVIEPVQ